MTHLDDMKTNTLDISSYDFSMPLYKSKLIINDNFHIYMFTKKPSWWWRMWQYLLLGFKWRDVK